MNNPIFSVIIPVYNEEASLRSCLQSIYESTLPREYYEVIVVDNGSDDHSVEIATEFQEAKLLEVPNCNVGKVRNSGASAAQGNYLVFIDSDCTISTEWLEKNRALIDQNPQAIFGGGILLPTNPNWIEKYWTLQTTYRSNLPKKLIGASILISKESFQRSGGFDETITSGEDSDFHDRLLKENLSVVFTNDMDVVHLGNAKTISQFVRRQAWHSENYIKDIRSSIKDPIFCLTVGWAFFLIAFSSSIFLAYSPYTSLTLLAGVLAIPALLTFKRLYRASNYVFSVKSLPGLYFMDCLYIAGRLSGIIHSIANYFRYSHH